MSSFSIPTLVLALVTIVPACKSPKGSDSLKGSVTPGVQWPDKKVEVCWENPDSVDRELLRYAEDRTISEYNRRTDFQFTPGWKRCDSNSRGIRISLKDQEERFVQAFGRELDGVPEGVVLNFMFKKTPWLSCQGDGIYYCIASDVLHELGHAIGLRHEMNRRDSSCAYDQVKGAGEAGAAALGVYDPDSIMNYCASVTQMSRIAALSAGDIKTINEYYSGKIATEVRTPEYRCVADEGIWDPEGACCTIERAKYKPTTERNYNYCARRVVVEFPSFDAESQFVKDMAVENPNAKLPEPMQIDGIEVECLEDGARPVVYRKTMSNADAIAGRATISGPDAASIQCHRLNLHGKIGTDSGTIYQLEDQTKPKIQNDQLRISGRFTLAMDASVGRRMTGVVIYLPDSAAQYSLKSGLIRCSFGEYLGMVNAENRTAAFDFVINYSQYMSDHVCTEAEFYDADSRATSSKIFTVDLGKTTVQAETKNEIDRSSGSLVAVQGEYPICGNNGRGYGEPFRCGNEFCAKATQESVNREDATSWCLFRSQNTEQVGGYTCEQQKSWGKCGEPWMHPVCDAVCSSL